MKNPLYINDFTYALPPDRIATTPLAERDASKLLVYKNGELKDDTFYHLPQFLPSHSLLVLNNTRVIEARLHFEKPTGGIIEIFCLEPYAPNVMESAMQQKVVVQWRCLIGGASKWGHGQVLQKELHIENESLCLEAHYMGKEADAFIIEFRWPSNRAFADVLHVAGAIPLPPYMKRKAVAADAERYQTVFAHERGSVAAPTAALHFTHGVLKKLEKQEVQTAYLTLHVGAGTFMPVKTETIDAHQMHAEYFSVTLPFLKQLLQANTIIAVGTTSLRTLESLHWLGVKLLHDGYLKNFELGQWEAYDLAAFKYSYTESLEALVQYIEKARLHQLDCRTSLLIRPGYPFQSAHAIVTNFHQPRSTLLLLIAAFIGNDWKKVYAHALEKDYRFLSYGDSSLLWRPTSDTAASRL
ncbi:MAG TPA: S-adenosylmethionine:tRNA ribosyltransferase-isomerase [Chitinophagaceae bacterium]|nr:S-adenosylmethionine:tRNA ribosyltransferase-isomerase [Chitinophagaceae bacterium]